MTAFVAGDRVLIRDGIDGSATMRGVVVAAFTNGLYRVETARMAGTFSAEWIELRVPADVHIEVKRIEPSPPFRPRVGYAARLELGGEVVECHEARWLHDERAEARRCAARAVVAYRTRAGV